LAVTSHLDGQISTATFSNVSLEQNDLVVPDVPGNVKARGVSGTQIAVTWTDTSHNATSFSVERSPDGVNYTVVGTTPKTTFIDSGLNSGHTYYYKVAAANAKGQSAFSDAASAAPPIPPV